MGSYFTEKYNPKRRHQFVKAHLAIGVRTHIVLTFRLTDEHGADGTQFVRLLGSPKSATLPTESSPTRRTSLGPT